MAKAFKIPFIPLTHFLNIKNQFICQISNTENYLSSIAPSRPIIPYLDCLFQSSRCIKKI